MIVTECTTTVVERAAHCVREARIAVTEACRGLARDVVEIARLLTSELVTNALQHGSGTITVEVKRTASRVRIAVGDDGPGMPRRLEPNPDATRGRGLMLVESLAGRWGVTPRDGGKDVWFELRTA